MGGRVPYLVVVSTGEEHELPENRTVKLGASAKCEIRVDADVAAIHGLVKYTGGKVIVAARDGSTKLFVNDVAIQKKVLTDGDRVRLDECELRLELREIVDPLLGAALAGYRIEEFLGRGGMGTVYRATQLSLNRPVALKVLTPELAADRELVGRFFKEAQAMARLNNPNVVQVYDALEAAHDGVDYVFFSMEYMPGGDLGNLVRREGPLPLENAFAAVYDAACALTWAEEHGIVHRDIKPDNLLISAAGATKVADLGIAIDRFVSQGERRRKKWVGSPRFMAPEQAMAQAVDHRADIYALGCTLVYALTGQYLFPGRSHVEILRAKVSRDPPSIRDFLPELSGEITDVVDTMVARDPEDRYATCLDLQNALHRALTRIVEGDTTAEKYEDDDHPVGARRVAARSRSGRISRRRSRPARNTQALILWGVAAVCVVLSVLVSIKLADLWPRATNSEASSEVARGADDVRRPDGLPAGGAPPGDTARPRSSRREAASDSGGPRSRTSTRLQEIFEDYRGGLYTATQAIGELQRLKRRVSREETSRIDQAVEKIRRETAEANERAVTREVNELVMPLVEKKRFREAYNQLAALERRYPQNDEATDQARQLVDDAVATAWKKVLARVDRFIALARFADAREAVQDFTPHLSSQLRAEAEARLASIKDSESAYLEARAAIAKIQTAVGAAIAALDFAKAAEIAAETSEVAKTTPGGEALAPVRAALREQPQLCEAVWNRLSAAAEDAIRQRAAVPVAQPDRPELWTEEYVFEELEGSQLVVRGAGRSNPKVPLLGLTGDALLGFLGGPTGVAAADLEGLGLLLLHSGRPFRCRRFLLDSRIGAEGVALYKETVDVAEDGVLSKILDETEQGVEMLEREAGKKSYAEACRRFAVRAAGWIVTLRESPKYEVARERISKAFLIARPEALRTAAPENLFHGKIASYRRSQIKLQYGFEDREERLDFHAVQKEGRLSPGEGTLTFRGEFRLARGNPFQERLVVTGSAVRYLPGSPNINIALWTRDEDVVTPIPEDPTGTTTGGTTGGTGGAGGTTTRPRITAIPDDYLVFGIGFRSRHYCWRTGSYDALEMDGVPGGAVPTPAYVLLGGVRGKPIHTVPDMECLWGAGAVGKFKGQPMHFQLTATPKRIDFTVNGSSRITRDRADVIVDRFGDHHGIGSVTLFTNGGLVTLSSLTIEAELNSHWVDERLAEIARAELAVFEDRAAEPAETPELPKGS